MTTTRREFVAQLGAMAVLGGTVARATPSEQPDLYAESDTPAPWYRRTLRWGQTNITEIDPLATTSPGGASTGVAPRSRGVIVNAAGIVAYYPSRYPLHYRAQSLEDRDMFGEPHARRAGGGVTVRLRLGIRRVLLHVGPPLGT
jgi:hypothetical protein